MRVEHLALYVKNLERAREFFIRYFGAVAGPAYHNPNTGFRSYFLSFEDGARLEIMWKPRLAQGYRSPPETGWDHVAFSVGSREAVEALTQRLWDDGYQVRSKPRVTGDGYYESRIVDVEGNEIEITV